MRRTTGAKGNYFLQVLTIFYKYHRASKTSIQLRFPITVSNYNFQLQFPIQIWFGLVWFGITTHSDQTLFLTQFYFRWVLQHIQACPELGPVAVPACFLTKLLLMKQLLHHVNCLLYTSPSPRDA